MEGDPGELAMTLFTIIFAVVVLLVLFFGEGDGS
jgi:hypothetical protein